MNKRIGWALGVLMLLVAGVALGQYATGSNYKAAGGTDWNIGGTLDVLSGGNLDIESGGSISIAGTAVTSTAAELNAIDGITSTVAELNILDGVTSTAAELNALDASARFVTLASGALTINKVHLATAAADYDIPATACDASADIGTWITVIVRDISEVVSITVDDTSNIMHVTGVALDADDELDSEGAATGDGDHVTLVCVAADNWYATATAGVWADGGGAD